MMKYTLTCIPCLLLAPLAGMAAAEPSKPNILFILADDQSLFDFKYHNPESTLDSPNIDRLASGGMIFDSFSSPKCTASTTRGAFPTNPTTA